VAAAMPGLPIWAIHADGIIVRPGPGLIEGAEAIASILHPDVVPAAPGRPGRPGRRGPGELMSPPLGSVRAQRLQLHDAQVDRA